MLQAWEMAGGSKRQYQHEQLTSAQEMEQLDPGIERVIRKMLQLFTEQDSLLNITFVKSAILYYLTQFGVFFETQS